METLGSTSKWHVCFIRQVSSKRESLDQDKHFLGKHLLFGLMIHSEVN